MPTIKRPPELEACGWFVRTKRTADDPTGALIADCSAAPDGAQCAREFAVIYDALDVLEIIHDADEDCRRDGLQPLPSMIRASIDAVLIKAGRLQLERSAGGL
ncbi:bacteriophage protein [Burkholderia pseudomallei]|nr:hypothetical protein BOC51_21235 [Burkholderia pseudomallei]CAJ4430139.1 bacteriophage protein [Burkholderia pseudomallei]CAJ4728288.1 bacteriophage protein [Burkholderia pseudomallei]CAJ5553526.1 bacteriophage protein [Burkholderia pseudomallei]CAJ7343335.1 bacteriophage protein [Burkholderia pseudomallei]